MLKNYFKIAWRNLRKNKVDSFISIGGLAVGIACCLLFIAFVQFEWSFDAFHKNGERIYRVYTTGFDKISNTQSKSPFSPDELASVIRENYPKVSEVVIIDHRIIDVKINGKFTVQEGVYHVQPGFFEVFSFPLVEGNAKAALRNTNGILISEDKALQLFGTVHAIGKKIELRINWDEHSYTVTGVMENVPKNSSLQFNYILPLLLNKERSQKNWRGRYQTFVLLKKHMNEEVFEKVLQNSITNYAPESWTKSNTIELQPLESIYLTPALSTGFEKSSNPLYAWILAGIAFIVLGIAAINFMSLTLSRASARSNEISVRKVVGASRGKLAIQFLGEACLTCLLAFLMGSVIANLILPMFLELISRPISLSFFYDPLMVSIVSGILLFVILITGGYPAFILSQQKTTTGFISRSTSGKIPTLVKGLIVVQFTLAIAFISSTLIMSNQMEYISNKDKGFNPENVIDIQLKTTGISGLQKAYKIYSQKIKRIPAVESFTGRFIPYGNYAIKGPSVMEDTTATLNISVIDEHYLETMEIEVLAGRGFSKKRPSELRHGILINKAAAEQWGWEQPLNKSLNDRKVIGVIDNFHKKPLYKIIEPAIFRYGMGIFGLARVIRVKIAAGKMEPALKKLKSVWNETFPYETFDYSFLEDTVQKYYSTQRSWKRIMEFASVIAIILACFGLFSLASLTAERRTKEIGIRKVMGATVANIVGLLNKDFLKLVLIGFVIAIPVAYYFMNQWLQDFAYRIDIGVGIFLLAGGLALLIALATVSWQSIRAALANPVDSLRSE